MIYTGIKWLGLFLVCFGGIMEAWPFLVSYFRKSKPADFKDDYSNNIGPRE